MNIRKFLICAVAFGAMATTSLLQAQDAKKGRGQGGGRGMGTPEQQLERLETAVGSLTAEQKTKIKAIYAKAAEKMQAIPQEERREKGMELMQATRKEVRAVLNAEQQKKFDEMATQARGGQGGEGGRRKKNT